MSDIKFEILNVTFSADEKSSKFRVSSLQVAICMYFLYISWMYVSTALAIEPGWPDWANFCLFDFWQLFENYRRSKNFGLLFNYMYKLCVNFDLKTGLGYILGDFFTNSSGHPDYGTEKSGKCPKILSSEFEHF
jgi:hypothetical protein